MTRGLKILAILVLALAIASCARKPEYQAAPASGEEIRIPLSSLQEGTPVFRSLEHEGIRIDFFVLRVNGRVESYFDACAKCYPKKRGYRADGDDIVCQACGQRFSMDALKGFGSCHPLPLEGRIEGENYVIDREDLIKGAKYF